MMLEMNIFLSRHARRRMKLYGIAEKEIFEAVRLADCRAGLNELLFSHPGIEYPVKVVFVVEDDVVTVVTSYPLKKGRIT